MKGKKNPIAKDLRTRKYRARVVKDKKKEYSKRLGRKKVERDR